MQRNSAVRGRHLMGMLGLALAGGTASLAGAQAGSGNSMDAQIAAGRQAYETNCAVCHGGDMASGQFAPALKGAGFLSHWAEPGLDQLFTYVRSSMPPGGAGGLSDETYAAIIAAIAAENGAKLEAPLSSDPAKLASIALPKPADGAAADSGFGGVTTRMPIPTWPTQPDRFANYTPVTEAMLDAPAQDNWLAWRGSHNGQGFSPLAQIDRSNVKNLRIAWAQPLPAGPAMAEPLVRDGVMYVYGFGDEVFALDAVSGDVLWRYQRSLPEGTPLSSKKTIALYGDKVFVATNDLHLVALDARNGRPVWDVEITDKPGFRNPGGPLAAEGVIMQGLTTQGAGGSLIASFDAETGKRLWTFNTIPAPGTPGGDTWNGLPQDERHGASVWTSGSYDPESGLALWGTAQTYDTGPLRDRKPGKNNDGLYTDSTLALDPHSGKLVWYFQHMKNDQWDLDWVFDRVIGTLDRGGKQQRVVMTAGKIGLFDVLDAKTGKYLDTLDMGIQDIVTSIDPKTGDKTVDPAKVPSHDKSIFACPNGGGGRNWSPTSFNPSTRQLYVVARDVCMDIVPGDPGFLTTGVNMRYAPPEGSDGRYGLLQGLDMEAGKIAWSVHQRAPYSMGVLTTASGLLFTGSVDRQVKAYDQANGKVLWQTGVTDVPNASPISYSVDGKQYIALVVGRGNPLSAGLGALTPEIQLPPVNSSAVYVFALPDSGED